MIEGTRLESDDEIRQAIEARRAQLAGRPAPGLVPTLVPGQAPAAGEPEGSWFRPVMRPPMALLVILDDGKSDGEVVRLRADRTVIGRSEGDVIIPHDAQISGKHAEIVRERSAGGYRWILRDLGSTNGTLVRIGSTILRHDNELVVGSGRYRFEAAGEAAAAAPPAGTPTATTYAWGGSPVQALAPSLVEMAPAGPVQRYLLTAAEYWIGRDAAACGIARPDDPYASPKHARLFRDAKGQWHAENTKSVNGLWLRMDQITLARPCQLRLGEQQFLFKPL